MFIKDRDLYSDYHGDKWNGTLIPKINEMYKLKVERLPQSGELNPQLAISGSQLKSDSLPVTLKQGWNWIAYTPLTTMTINEALAGANPQKGDIVKSQTGVAIYGTNAWEGNLQALESGRGYMYSSTDSQEKSFVYPSRSSASARMAAPRRAPEAEVLRIFTPVAPSLYPNNLTMVIQLKDGDAVVDTAEVAAFIDGECRSAARAINGLYYLVISGENAGETVTLRTCLDDYIVTIDDTQRFVSDSNIGTPWQPYVINLRNVVTGITEISNDDDDDDWWTLQGLKVGRKPTRSGVYIHRGKTVVIRNRRQTP